MFEPNAVFAVLTIMRPIKLAIALFVVAITTLRAEPEVKGTAADLTQFLNGVSKTVVVTGEAEVRTTASRAVMTLSVMNEGRTLQDTLRANADVRSRVIAQLKQQGVGADRIQVAKFSSTPKYGMSGDKTKSYRVENVIRVSVLDEKELRNVAGVVDAFGEVQFGGIEFEYADREALKQKAIAQACANAGERKKIYEESLGLKLAAIRFGETVLAEAEPKPQPTPRKSEWSRSLGSDYTSVVQEGISSFGELVFTAKIVVEYTVGK